MELALAMVFAKDLERMAAFYQGALGLTPLPAQSSPGWAVFDAGGCEVALHAIPEHIARGFEIAVPPTAREATPIKLVFRTSDVEGVCVRVLALGGVVLPVHNAARRDVLDPEGNVVQLRRA